MSPSKTKHAYALKSKKALRLVPKMLDKIDEELGVVAKEVEEGDIDINDLEWENELDADPGRKNR